MTKESERHFVSVDVEPGDPHNDQMAAMVDEDLDRHIESARNMLAGAETDDKPAQMAAIATALLESTHDDGSEVYPRERLASMLAAAQLRLLQMATERDEFRESALMYAAAKAEQVPGLQYLLWDMERQAWWAPDRNGYTDEQDTAGRYSQAEAVELALMGSLGGLGHATVIVADHGSVKR